ncbi:hypothetical protein CEXT_655981, partial [Caerostris extrusa]
MSAEFGSPGLTDRCLTVRSSAKIAHKSIICNTSIHSVSYVQQESLNKPQVTLASGHGKDSYRRVAQHLLAHILPTKDTTAYITFSTLRPNETVKISPSKSGDSADMAETQPQ